MHEPATNLWSTHSSNEELLETDSVFHDVLFIRELSKTDVID